jgi:N-acetylmuramoyl-L-alanine amidase
VVQSGDSLSVIAQRYGTSVRALKDVNSLVSDRLLVGQILKLPSGAEAPAAASGGGDSTPGPRPTPVATRPIPPRPTPTPIPVDVDPVDPPGAGGEGGGTFIDKPYPIIVQEGDTLESIAENYIVTVEKIRELNDLNEWDEVKPGQKLMMPATIY